jgi:hypothetical protein
MHFAPFCFVSSHGAQQRRRQRHSSFTSSQPVSHHPEYTMIAQIISHTPLYVWALLAFLIYRGVIASADRVTPLGMLFIIPGVMLALSLQDLERRFGLQGMPLLSWLAGAAAGAAIAWSLIDARRIVVDRAKGTVAQRGSWVPLTLMLAIFCTKYAVAILFAIRPSLSHDAAFILAIPCLFGLFNGVFIGRLARPLAVYLRQPAALAS